MKQKRIDELKATTLIPRNHKRELSRRQFLVIGGLTVTASYAGFAWTRGSSLITLPVRSFTAVLNDESDLADYIATQAYDDSALFELRDVVASPVDVLRHEDLLALRFEFENLFLRVRRSRAHWYEWLIGKKTRREFTLERTDPSRPSYLIVHFPPQHVLEKCYFQASDLAHSDPLEPPPVPAQLGGGTRLAFHVPDTIAKLPFDLKTLLDWAVLEPSLVATAVAANQTSTANLVAPSKRETSIEIPYNLILSPNSKAAWLHSDATDKTTSGCGANRQVAGSNAGDIKWVELWHTRLATQIDPNTIDEENEFYRTVRAVWSNEMSIANTPPNDCFPIRKKGDPQDYLTSMDARDRYEIVNLTSNFRDLEESKDGNWTNYRPRPIKVKKLLLSSLGGSITSDGNWPIVRKRGGSKLNVREWHQEASFGRDQYVRVVYGGYLYPYGHPCSMIQITERRFQKMTEADREPITAYLRQEITIAIEVATKATGSSGLKDGNASIDRKMPFKRIEITTKETPPLDRPSDSVVPVPGNNGVCAFWPKVAGQDFLFHLVKNDVDGNETECLSPAIFVVQSRSEDPATLTAVSEDWRDKQAGRRPMNGQKVSFVPSTSSSDSRLETFEVNFDAFIPPQLLVAPATQPHPNVAAAPAPNACEAAKPDLPAPWEPTVEEAKVKLPAVENTAGPQNPVRIDWHPSFLEKGFDLGIPNPNVGELFARIKNPLSLQLPSSRGIGLAKPDFGLTGLTRRFGPLGGDASGLDSLSTGKLDVKNLLAGFHAKILGAVDLFEVLADFMTFDSGGGGHKIPKTITRIINDDRGLPLALENSVRWRPDLKDKTGGIAEFIRGPECSFEIDVTTTSLIREHGTTTYLLKGVLTDFHIVIFQAINVGFYSCSFISASGQKPKVDIDLAGVEFQGALAFVNKLQEYLSQSLFGENGPTIILTTQEIITTVTIPVPDLSFGAFSLQNIHFSARLYLPFRGDKPLRLRVAFGERNNTFLVSVTFLGGGGFVAFTMGLDGIETLELALEFGGVVAIAVGVAEGEVHALGGIYILYRIGKGAILTGYFRVGGSVTVLGLVTVTMEQYLGLSYDPGTGKVWGTAEVSVEISIGFFSKSVTFSITREFIGGKNEKRLLAAEAVPKFAPFGLSHIAQDNTVKFRDQMPQRVWRSYWSAFDLNI